MDAVTETDESDSRSEAPVDLETALARIRERGDAICEREQNRAVRRLRGRRDLSDREERVVRALAERLTDQLLAVPEAHLRAAESTETNDETARIALELFGEG